MAAVFATFTGQGWRIAVFVLAAIAGVALLLLIGTGFRPASEWVKQMWRQDQLRREEPRRLITDRWQYTPVGFDVGPLANLGQKAFSHRSYVQPSENKPPAVRLGVFVSCGPLAGDEPTAEHLRALMRDCLGQPEVMGLISKLTDAGPDASWHSRPGWGRFNLEADLVSPSGNGLVLASALLLLPEQGIKPYGKDHAGAELYLHVDLPVKAGVPAKAGITEWHDRFTVALSIPALLARFLERAGLPTSGTPATRFAMHIQARTTASMGLDEIVDFGNLAVLLPRKYSMQFDGWAVADQQGKTADAISRRFVTELCECTGRTGYEGILAELRGGGQHRGAALQPTPGNHRGGHNGSPADNRKAYPGIPSHRVASVLRRGLTRRRIAVTSVVLLLAVVGTGAGLWLSRSSSSAGPLKVNTCARTPSNASAPVKIGSITTGSMDNDFVDVAFSPDCQVVAAGGNGVVNEWDMVTGNRIATLSAAPGSAVDIDAFTPNGKALAIAGGDGNTTLWNAATGYLEARFASDPSGSTYCLVISPDSAEIFTGGSTGVVGIWAVTTRQPVGSITTGIAIGAMALSPNGKLLAVAGYDGIIRIYDTADYAQVATLSGNEGHIWSMAFSPDGSTLAAGSNVLQWWDVATGKLIAYRDSPGRTVTDVAFSTDGTILAAGGYDVVGLWDARTHQLITTLNLGVTSASAVGSYPNGMAFSRYGAILAVGWAGTLQFWNVAGLGQLSVRRMHYSISITSPNTLSNQFPLSPTTCYRNQVGFRTTRSARRNCRSSCVSPLRPSAATRACSMTIDDTVLPAGGLGWRVGWKEQLVLDTVFAYSNISNVN
jgi:WD domain, G-beta repeat